MSAAAAASTNYANDSQYDHKAVSKAYRTILPTIGTLANGRVYVAVSTLDDPNAMFGLFAGVDIKKDEVVTEYGGVLDEAKKARMDAAPDHSHTFRVSDSDFVRNGKPWAKTFMMDGFESFYREELLYEAKDRTHVEPVSTNQGLNNHIRTTGIGYMTNTDSNTVNVKIKHVNWDQNGLHPRKIVFIATRDIPRDTEIILDYKLRVDRG